MTGPDERPLQSEANKPRGTAFKRHAHQVLDATNNRRAVHSILYQGILSRGEIRRLGDAESRPAAT